jgi:hypothetical protein
MPRAVLILLLAMSLPAVASADQLLQHQQVQQQQSRVLDVLSIYRDLNDMCRGRGGEDAHALKACNVREKVGRLLNSLGYCYGNQNQNAADLQWHKCAEADLF